MLREFESRDLESSGKCFAGLLNLKRVFVIVFRDLGTILKT